MGWLQRLMGGESVEEKAAKLEANYVPPKAEDAPAGDIPPERVGLNGEYDQSGLAKRVAQALDEDPEVAAIDTVWVAQLTGTVVLKGKAPNQAALDKIVQIAGGISGATGVDSTQVEVTG